MTKNNEVRKKFISSYRLQSIIKGSQEGNSRQMVETELWKELLRGLVFHSYLSYNSSPPDYEGASCSRLGPLASMSN